MVVAGFSLRINFYFLFSILYPLFSIFYPLSSVWAAKIHPKAGTTAASFLKIAPGARAVSMGESFVAVSNDATAVWWNPAGLAGLACNEITAMHNESFQDLRYEFLGYVQPLASKAQRHRGTKAQSDDQEKYFHQAIGISAYGLIVQNTLERRSGLGETDVLRPLTASEGTFGANDMAGAVSYGMRLGAVSFGSTIKLIRQTIDNERAQGVAGDFGALFQYRRDIAIGMVVQDIGKGIIFSSRRFRLPTTYRVGGAKTIGNNFTASVEFSKPIDNYLKAAIGTEYRFSRYFVMRGGYSYRLHGNDLGGLSGLTLGAGLSDFGLSAFRRVGLDGWNLDYAFNPAGDLGNTHRISISVKFGK